MTAFDLVRLCVAAASVLSLGRATTAVDAICILGAKISYSLYLCHGLVLLSLGKWFGPNSAFPLHRETWIWCIAVGIVSMAVASAVYRWFGKPMMDQRDRVKSEAAMNTPAVSTGLSADQAG